MLFQAKAQDHQHSLTCGHDHVLQHLALKNDGFQQAMQANLKAAAKNAQDQSKSATVYQIPVVFHVVYNTEEQNLPDEVFEDQIEILTEDFRRLNENASETREIFQDIAGDAEIEFYLATEDPDGNPTNGINRVETDRPGFELDLFSDEITLDEVKFEETGGTPSWGIEYLNIWVCNIQDGLFGQIFGFAYPPNGAANWEGFFDVIGDDITGVVIHYTAVGSNNPSASEDGFDVNDGGRTLTHEVGHFLGLRHIWGDAFFDGCSTDDGISDTPDAAAGANYICDYTLDDCTDDALPNMIENYMDYNEDDCFNMFTQEQVDIMRFNLENYREELIEGQIVSVEESRISDFNIFPNPTSGAMTIESDESMVGEKVEILNQLGQTLQTLVLESTSKSINVDIPAGIYWIRIGSLAPQRFVRW